VSNTLIRLIDNALVPAFLLFLGKLSGLFIISTFWNIEIDFAEYSNNFIKLAPFVEPSKVVFLSTYSDLIMYLFVAIYFVVVLLKAIFLHDTHISPQLVVKLVERNIYKIIQNTYDLYHNATIALAFMWIASILVWINYLSDINRLWVAIVCTLISVILTSALLQDVYREIEEIKKNPGRL
jgi:hypothetical protein